MLVFFSTSAGPRRSVSLEVVGMLIQSAVKFRFQFLQLVLVLLLEGSSQILLLSAVNH